MHDPDFELERPSSRGSSSATPALVTIVIPAFNAAATLKRAILSARGQTWPNIEILVVDDGSTDATSIVASAFSEVRYVHQPNRGVSAARNAGAAASTGEYVVFLDADDELLPNMVSDLVSALERVPAAAAASGAYQYRTEDRVERLPDRAAGPDIAEPGTGVVRDFFAAHGRHHIVCVGAALVRASAIHAVGGFREDLRFGEDINLWTRIAGRFLWVYVDIDVVRYHHLADTSVSRRVPYWRQPTNWLLTDDEVGMMVRPELRDSYRRFRRDVAVRQARNALHVRDRETARAALRRIQRAPLSLDRVVTGALARIPSSVSYVLLRSLFKIRQLAAERLRGRRGTQPHPPT